MSQFPILRADVPPLGETYDTATLHVLPTGALVTIDVEFYRNTKTRVILTHAQAKALRAALDDAIGKTAYTILKRQQEAYLQAADAEPCPTCEGTGKLPDHDAPYGFTGVNVCKDCSGTGEVQS
ncbi:MAG: hypothetical protein BWK73_41795 [Thiothrix lacustris]|uniref:Uncharacterized protein n=1 Tax=Thiothrix lacustris TaxID=525917 RepID=A0A1Y1QCQ2_9GAMM|nr:MAG: hypothetical protein BWK73_41795 [Thiothrix lacustris]